MARKKKGVVAVTGMIMVVLSVSIIIPAIAISLESPQEDTLDMIEGERQVLTGSITVEAVTVDGGGNADVNISVVDEQTGTVAYSGNLAEGSIDTVNVASGNITIEVLDILGGSEAIVKFTYPTYIGYPPNATVIFENIVLFLITATMLLIGGVLFIVSEVYANG